MSEIERERERKIRKSIQVGLLHETSKLECKLIYFIEKTRVTVDKKRGRREAKIKIHRSYNRTHMYTQHTQHRSRREKERVIETIFCHLSGC